MVEAVLTNWRTAPVSEKVASVLTFLEKLTLRPAEISPTDIPPMFAAGVTAPQIEDAIYICYLFNVITRLADAFEFDVKSSEKIQAGAKNLYNLGYGISSIPG